MQTKSMSLQDIMLDQHNARQHDANNLKTIAKSLDRFGQQKPIVVDSSCVVIAGNGTVQAARTLGWTHIDVVQTELKGDEARAFAIADNRTTDLSGWNYTELIEQLGNFEQDMQEIAGFDESAVAELLDLPKSFDEKKPVGMSDGDTLQMGEYSLTCDSHTTAREMAEMLNGTRLPPSVCAAVERYWNSNNKAGA